MELPDFGLEPTMPVLARRAYELYADRNLIVTPDERVTFGEIERKSHLLARQLLASGVGKGSRVGMQFPYCKEFFVAFLAVTRIGALALPLSTTYASGELRRSMRRLDMHTLIVAEKMMDRDQLEFIGSAVEELSNQKAPLMLESLPHLRQIWVLGQSHASWAESISMDEETSLVTDAMLEAVEADVSPADWLVVINTSGSTAEPKGIIHTHGSVIRKTLTNIDVTIPGPPMALFSSMPLFWVGGLITLTSALANGVTMVCQPRLNVDQILDLVEQERCVAVSAWLSVVQALREHPGLADRNLEFCPMLTEPQSARPYGTPLGMTETGGPHLSAPHPGYGMEPPSHLWGSLGVEGPYFDHKMVAPGTDEVVTGEPVEGEICVRGYAILNGMYKRERETVFDDDGYYHTGDILRKEEGLYFFTGRATEMIKTQGANVAPPEVETILESLDELKQAFVVGIPDAEREEIVAAVVVASDGFEVDLAAVQQKCRAEISTYKIPRVLLVMAEDDVPWLATGKPDKRRMKDMLVEHSRSTG